MRPGDLLACQADFVRRMESAPQFSNVIVNSLSAPYESHHRKVPTWIENQSADAILRWAKAGMAIEVTPHMTDLITWVAAEMRETDPIDIGLQPSPYGFCHFEKPLVAQDIRGEQLHVDWIIWGPIPIVDGYRATGVIGFNDKSRPDSSTDMYVREMERLNPTLMQTLGRWVYTSFHALIDTERIGPALTEPDPDTPNSDPEWQGELSASTNMMRYVFALWQVMNQPIAVLERPEVDRSTRRRMTRMKIPPQVTVITLRRPENPHRHDEEGHVEWQHHWVVRGHPRWQAYGPGRSERKLIWINPHVRGNLDAPLHQSDKVYRVSR